MTAEEIRTILTASEQESALDPQLNMMLRGVFDLDDHMARDAMIPRTEVVALPHTSTVEDVLALFREDLRGRYPVYETSVDNVIGVVSMKQLLHRLSDTSGPKESLDMLKIPVTEVMMEAYFVPDTLRLSTLLKDFTSNQRQMAIVLDEYGGTEGLITLEDILEEIVGDYEDEFSPRHRHIKMEDKQHYVIAGGVRVTELEPKLNFPFPTGDYVTLGGLINHRLGRIANVGDVVKLEGARLKVLAKDRHQITKVYFEETPAVTEDDHAEAEPAVVEEQPERNLVGWSANRALKDQPKEASVPDAAHETIAAPPQAEPVEFTRKTGS
jgi:CBS domain containing-hemolysin-like protein